MIQALWVIAQARDQIADSDVHRTALSAALLAFREAEDFAPSLGPTTTGSDVSRLVASHRTPLLRDHRNAPIRALDALQQYYDFAQERLVTAMGKEFSAAEVLYVLARIQMAPARIAIPQQRLSGAKAMALYMGGKGNYEEILKELDVTIGQKPDLSIEHSAAAFVSYSLADMQRAEQELALALKLNPVDYQALELKKMMSEKPKN